MSDLGAIKQRKNHPSLINIKLSGKVSQNKNVFDGIEDDDDLFPIDENPHLKSSKSSKSFHKPQESVLALNEANLTKKGKDFWENKTVYIQCCYLLFM